MNVHGTSVKFTKKKDRYFLHVKTLNTPDSLPRLTQYTTEIDQYEWTQLENMVNDFDFWIAEQFKTRNVLDGYVLLLEGSRYSRDPETVSSYR